MHRFRAMVNNHVCKDARWAWYDAKWSNAARKTSCATSSASCSSSDQVACEAENRRMVLLH